MSNAAPLVGAFADAAPDGPLGKESFELCRLGTELPKLPEPREGRDEGGDGSRVCIEDRALPTAAETLFGGFVALWDLGSCAGLDASDATLLPLLAARKAARLWLLAVAFLALLLLRLLPLALLLSFLSS